MTGRVTNCLTLFVSPSTLPKTVMWCIVLFFALHEDQKKSDLHLPIQFYLNMTGRMKLTIESIDMLFFFSCLTTKALEYCRISVLVRMQEIGMGGKILSHKLHTV